MGYEHWMIDLADSSDMAPTQPLAPPHPAAAAAAAAAAALRSSIVNLPYYVYLLVRKSVC